MKKSGIVTTLFFAMAFAMPLFVSAQTAARPASDIKGAQRWVPIKLDANGGNVKDGVEFYSHPSECLLEKADVVKLVNKNSYGVKIAYKPDANSAVQYVRVSPGATIEGICGSADQNLAKLVMSYPGAKSNEELKKVKQDIVSSIVVSKL
ncbi:MAG: hypothetical protein ACXVPN_07090 [Bacteroidia bacterium]